MQDIAQGRELGGLAQSFKRLMPAEGIICDSEEESRDVLFFLSGSRMRPAAPSERPRRYQERSYVALEPKSSQQQRGSLTLRRERYIRSRAKTSLDRFSLEEEELRSV